jgi:hypothetical protein
MAVSFSNRLALPQWSSSADEFTREQMTDAFASIGDDAAVFISAASATPPASAPANEKSFYWDNTNGKLYFRGDTNASATHAYTQIFPVLPAGHIHSDLQPLDSDLTAIAGLSATGIIVRTASGTAATRKLTVSGSGISIANDTGVVGDIGLTIASASANTPSTLVFRDTSGNFIAGTITAALTGNASTATAWATARNLSLTGDATATLSAVDGSAAVSAAITLATVNTTTGSYGSDHDIPTFTVNAKGLVTASGSVSVRNGSTSVSGFLQLTDSVSSTSTTTAATPASVKSAYDLAALALPYAGGTITGKLTTVASGTSTASILLSAGSADPSAPVTGDLWNNAGTLKLRQASATKTIAFIDGNIATATTWATARTITLAGDATGSVSINGSADATLTVTVADDSHTHNTIYYTETEVNNAKLYQYGNTGGVPNAEGTSGAVLGATRVTPRIYVQTTNPGTTGVIGDIWFEI